MGSIRCVALGRRGGTGGTVKPCGRLNGANRKQSQVSGNSRSLGPGRIRERSIDSGLCGRAILSASLTPNQRAPGHRLNDDWMRWHDLGLQASSMYIPSACAHKCSHHKTILIYRARRITHSRTAVRPSSLRGQTRCLHRRMLDRSRSNTTSSSRSPRGTSTRRLPANHKGPPPSSLTHDVQSLHPPPEPTDFTPDRPSRLLSRDTSARGRPPAHERAETCTDHRDPRGESDGYGG